MVKLNISALEKVPGYKKLTGLFVKNGYTIRIAGGAVRDLLQGEHPNDVDFATEASVDEMKEMVDDVDIKPIHPSGEEKHGTVTVVIDGTQFEITTLRKPEKLRPDLARCGKWTLDANLRDLTINAMFLDLEGNLYDYVGGYSDLKNGLVRFVGDAEERIKEDTVRILRYFRFIGRISPSQDDQATLRTISANAHLLTSKDIPKQRIWGEFAKILTGDNSDKVLEMMNDCGILRFFGLPHEINMTHYCKVRNASKGMDPLPITLLAALLTNKNKKDYFDRICSALQLSAKDEAILRYVRAKSNRDVMLRKKKYVKFAEIMQIEYRKYMAHWP